jgi:hypothetical protein
MKKKIKTKSILLIIATLYIYSCSILTDSAAQETISITSHGCTMCNTEQNEYFVNWSWTGSIPEVSIYFYDVSITTLEYIIIENATNIGGYEWIMPGSHTLDGNYSLVVCDSSNHHVNDSVYREVYPIQTYTPPNIPGYPLLVTGLIIGITSAIVALILTKKLKQNK